MTQPESAIPAAAPDAAMPAADQLPLPGLSGHSTRRDDRGHPVHRTPGGGLTGHAAFDSGADLWVSKDGVPAHAERLTRPTPKRPLCHDPVEAIRLLFAEDLHVATEAPTLSSFKMRGRIEEVVAVLGRHPHLGLYTIGSQSVQNELRRQWRAVEAGTAEAGNLLAAELRRLGRPYNAATDHHLAAATIWHLAARHQPKRWRPPDPERLPYRVDPDRPNVGGLVQMRSDGYPDHLWRRHVVPYLPPSGDLDPDQRKILCNGREWARDRCSALVWSLSEPPSASRRGWWHVIGASSHGRPNLYRQMLVVGKPRADYQHGHHFTGPEFTDAMRAMRGLRAIILKAHPHLPGSQP